MNKHIELVKKWLADPASVSQQELEDNRAAAAYAAACACFMCADAYAAYAAAYAAYADTAADAAAYAADAAYWVERYEELTK